MDIAERQGMKLVLESWIDDCCIRDKSVKSRNADLWRSFRDWYAQVEYDPRFDLRGLWWSSQKFHTVLDSMGFDCIGKRNGSRTRRGIFVIK